MSRLHDSACVDRPLEQAQQGLERFLISLRRDDGISRMRLRVPMDGHAFELSLDREVRVEARPIADRGRDILEIAWAPEGSTVFPRFAGTLAVRGNGDPEQSVIELDGSYTPPFGAAGQIFDAAIGKQIAQATAREFLKDLKLAIESRAN